jgi:hypothetical protein
MVAYSLYREEAIYAAATDCDIVFTSEISMG